MYNVEIDGNEYEIRVTLGAARKIVNNFEVDKSEDWSQEMLWLFMASLVWEMLKPRGVIFKTKPFLTFKRFLKYISIPELEKAGGVVNGIMYGNSEDKEQGNDQTL